MRPESRVYVAGHRGLAGSAIVRALDALGYRNLILRSRAECDLTRPEAVQELFREQLPEYVFLAAARVGGIAANNTFPSSFLTENLLIQLNVIEASRRFGVKRLLFLGSSCIYPRDCPQPMTEDRLMTGPLEPTNRPYAVAKIAGIEACWASNRQYGTRFLAAMPTNLYGPGDNFDIETSHVVPALIRKMHEAREAGRAEVTIWGTGAPLREFLYSDDMAKACVLLMNLDDPRFEGLLGLPEQEVPPLINIGSGEEVSIEMLARLVSTVVGFPGSIGFDRSRPDGTPRKLLDSSRLRALGWAPSVGLAEGISRSYGAYLERFGV